MAKYLCMACGWKGDTPAHECEGVDIRHIRPNYPRLAKSNAKPEKTAQDKELEAKDAEIAKLKEELAKKETKTT